MALCYNCGSTMDAGVRFCTDCGAVIPGGPEPQAAPAPSQADNTLVAGVATLPAHDDFSAPVITAPATQPSRKPLLIIFAVGTLFITALVLLLVLKPFSNKPPVIEGIDASQLVVHAGDSVKSTARASDPNDDDLTYKWTASAGQLVGVGDGSTITLSTAADPGSVRANIKVHVTVSDGRGGTTSADKTITVTPAVVASAGAPAPTPGNQSGDGWEILQETRGANDAAEALGAPDQKTAALLPGGELAMSLIGNHFFGNGPGGDLLVYGPKGDRTSYTVFVRDDPSGEWLHVDVNRSRFGASGFASHDIGHHGVQQARQVKVRNDDGNRNLFVDAIVVAHLDQMSAHAPSHHHH